MYAAKAAAGGGPPGQVQGQQGVSSSGQGMVCVGYRNIRADCSSSTWSPLAPWMSISIAVNTFPSNGQTIVLEL